MTLSDFVNNYALFLTFQLFLAIASFVLVPLLLYKIVFFIKKFIHKSLFGDVASIDDISYTKI